MKIKLKQQRGLVFFDTCYVVHHSEVPRVLTLKPYAPSKVDFEILLDTARINYYTEEVNHEQAS